LSADGYIATNRHVVEFPGKVTVVLHDDVELDARIVASDEDYDIAVLKVEPRAPLCPLPLGSSGDLRPGQAVLALGHPLGNDLTVTAGIVGGAGRNADLTAYDHFVQTDAVLNPGNSGGPLLDSSGRVVGINCAAFRVFKEASFAVPVDFLKAHLPEMKEGRSPKRTWIGAELVRLTREQARKRKISREVGLYVESVRRGLPAEKAGLRRGDIIVELDGRPMRRCGEFIFELQKRRVGDTVSVGVIRMDSAGREETLRLDIFMAERPARLKIF
jgi:serine protease Do